MPAVKVNIYQAKTNLSRLIGEVQEGKEVIIARAGRPVAKLVPFQTPRKLGMLKGKLSIPDDFDEPLPEDVLAAFEGAE